MACSKIFSGDLIELTNKIIQYFHHDYKTLHSCILINRLWCRLAIPLLWEDPFSKKYPKNYHFIEILLHNLNEDDKTKLHEYEINSELFPSNTLFNYPSFIKSINIKKIILSIREWLNIVSTSTFSNGTDTFEIYFPNHFIQNTPSCLHFFIFKLLFKIFIETKVNLHTFEAKDISYSPCIFYNLHANEIIFTEPDFICDNHFIYVFELILQNPNFFHNIRNLNLGCGTIKFDKLIKNCHSFGRFLNSNCNSISSLYFYFSTYVDNTLNDKYLSQLISSRQNIKKILFGTNINFPFYHSLLSLKNSNCSNTLTTIIFHNIKFGNINILKEVFEELNALESIHLLCCYSLNANFIQQIVNINKPFKLKSLILIEEPLHIESLQLLFQISGGYLENFGSFSRLNESELLESIIKYCQILPFKLEYLNLRLIIKPNDFEIFLKNSQNTFIKKLLIKNMNYQTRDILPHIEVIKKYIIKKKRVEYLAIKRASWPSRVDKELFLLKDEVKEFKLHNIQVLRFDDLYINFCNFIKEIV
ncbi:hypothetical protein C1645_875279 [Glomus cerebriforme]|uniref:F-box domain-containing protein n=1 Tax=Glomus cerebriforme TaxID=658196 RepID=A0A397T9D5_9GLOM|nr:hypothetical protein C1645_875279 [Glomus cerebriforme]